MRLRAWNILAAGLLLIITAVWLVYSNMDVKAQSSSSLASMTIALWPEYDRPAVLVIYRGEVAPEVSLPATVRFELPATVSQMHAVAHWSENTNTLVNLDDFHLEATPQGKLLTLTTPVRGFHVEYYVNDLLSFQGDTRIIRYVFTAPVTIANFSFEVQQPVDATDFTSEPQPVSITQRGDGLLYARYVAERITAGESRSLRVTYKRTTNVLSFEAMHQGTNVSFSPPLPSATDTELPLGWVIGLVGSFFLGVGLTYYVCSQRYGKRRESAFQAASVKHGSVASYCYQCGVRLFPEALYCHVCGTPRRGISISKEEPG